MDSIDKVIQERLDVCRMADKLHLDGVEKLSVAVNILSYLIYSALFLFRFFC